MQGCKDKDKGASRPFSRRGEKFEGKKSKQNDPNCKRGHPLLLGLEDKEGQGRITKWSLLNSNLVDQCNAPCLIKIW